MTLWPRSKAIVLLSTLKNLASLGGIQAANAVLPLVIFPYSLSVVGGDAFAPIVLAESIAVFLGIVVFYSFEIEGVARVVGLDPKRDSRQLSLIFSGVVYVRLILFACTAPVGLVLAWLWDPALAGLVLAWLMLPLAYALQANWVCLGLERNAFVAGATWFTRLLALMIIVATLTRDHAGMIPVVVASTVLLSSLASLVYVMLRLNVRLIRVPAHELWRILLAGRHVFLANLTVGLYRDVNVLILGGFGAGGGVISAYAMSEKFVKMIQASIRPFNQIFFPRIIALTMQAGRPSPDLLSKLMRFIWPQVGLLFLILMFVIAWGLIANDVLGWRLDVAADARSLFLVMCLSTFVGVANFILGMAGLAGLGEARHLMKMTIWTGCTNVILVSILVHFYGGMGAAIGFVAAEVIMLALIVKKYLRN